MVFLRWIMERQRTYLSSMNDKYLIDTSLLRDNQFLFHGYYRGIFIIGSKTRTESGNGKNNGLSMY